MSKKLRALIIIAACLCICASALCGCSCRTKRVPTEPTGGVSAEGERDWSDDLSYVWRGFLPYVEEFDGAYNEGVSVSVDSRDELTAYMEYVQYRYITAGDAVGVQLSYDYTGSVSAEIRDAYNHAYFSSYIGLGWNVFPVVRIYVNKNGLLGNEASRVSAQEDYYRQIEPYYYRTEGAEHPLVVDNVKTTLNCETSNQLFYAAMVGARPVCAAGSAAERLYGKARAVLAGIVTADMSAYKKTLAIYEWLIMNVSYDQAAYDQSADTSDTQEVAKYESFYLEGVFDSGRAVCDGISKAMVLLCRMEGLPCVRVVGEGHAWNKVYLDKWYVIDATFGDTVTESGGQNYSFMTHRYFLTADDANEYYAGALNYRAADYVAAETFDYYAFSTFTYLGRTYDFVVDGFTDFAVLQKWADSLGYDGAYSVDFRTVSPLFVSKPATLDGEYGMLFYNI